MAYSPIFRHRRLNSGAGLKDLMARMRHDSERAAMIYQHQARGADQKITDVIESHVEAERGHDGGDRGACPCGLIARTARSLLGIGAF
jgi:hypothetical protein